MKFGPKFNKLFAMYPAIDTTQIEHNRLHNLTRKELYVIIRGLKESGVETPAQPTRTSSFALRSFIYSKMSKD